MVKIAILDDYQRVARSFADWSRVESGNEIVVFDQPFKDEADVVAKLADFEVLCILRERTRFPRSVIEKPAEAAIDCVDRDAQRGDRHEGGRRARHRRVGDQRRQLCDSRADHRPDAGRRPLDPAGGRQHARRPLADDRRHGVAGQDARSLGPRPARRRGRQGRCRARHETDRLEPEPDRRARRRDRRPARRERRAVQAIGRAVRASRAVGSLARAGRSARTHA